MKHAGLEWLALPPSAVRQLSEEEKDFRNKEKHFVYPPTPDTSELKHCVQAFTDVSTSEPTQARGKPFTRTHDVVHLCPKQKSYLSAHALTGGRPLQPGLPDGCILGAGGERLQKIQ
jgi:hypothetical protein